VAAGEGASVGGVLPGDSEDVVHQHAGRVEQRSFGHVECLQLLADALVDVQQRGPPRLPGELGADPGVGVDRIEQAECDGAQHIPGLGDGNEVSGGRRR